MSDDKFRAAASDSLKFARAVIVANYNDPDALYGPLEELVTITIREAVREEREACARIADAEHPMARPCCPVSGEAHYAAVGACESIATEIRERGNR